MRVRRGQHAGYKRWQQAISTVVPVFFPGESRAGSPKKFVVRGLGANHEKNGALMERGGKPGGIGSICLRFGEYLSLTSGGTPMFKGEKIND